LGLYEEIFMVINNSDFHKVQINRTRDQDAEGNIIRQSLMINIRTNDVQEGISLYNELKSKLNGNITSAKITNEGTNGNIPICSTCGRQMILRKNKKGENFWGCDFPRCRQTLPYETNSTKQEVPTTQVEKIPF